MTGRARSAALRLFAVALLATRAVVAEPGDRDEQLLREMAAAHLAEIAAGKIALGKAGSETVRKYAQLMVDAHGKLLAETETVAKARSIALPPQPDGAGRAGVSRLEATSAGQFDHAYVAQVVARHRETLRLVQQAAQAGGPTVKALAAKVAPHLEKHLEIAERML